MERLLRLDVEWDIDIKQLLELTGVNLKELTVRLKKETVRVLHKDILKPTDS